MRNGNKAAWIAGALIMGGLSLGGCATKKYVAKQLTPVASQAQAQEAHIGTLEKTAQDALDRATAAGKLAEGKFLYSVVLTDDGVHFPFDRSALSPEAEAKLQDLLNRLKTDNKNVYIEVQGHTDSTGAKTYNYQLGEDRAEAVRRYLNSQGVALNRMSSISYGPDAPATSNRTREGRAQNRRVVLVVLV